MTQPPPRGLPLGNGPTAFPMLRILSGRLGCSCLGGSCLDVCLCVCAVVWKLTGLRDRRRAGSTSFWGSSFLFGMLLVLAPPGAVPVVGGFSDPSVPRSPGVSPQRVQGGPWAPPPCGVKSSETCWVCVCLFVRFFWDGCWLFYLGFCLWGWNDVCFGAL